MRQAIRELAVLNDADFFAAVAEGLGHIRESLSDLLAGQEGIPEENSPARAVLRALANEEAGKALLLLDAVRCPRGRVGEHLRRFNSHIAKGLYAEIVGLHFVTFGDLTEYVDRERREYYRDGFDDGPEWIFYNDILFRREQTMYVDRLRTSDGQVTWTSPRMILALALTVNAPHSAEWLASLWTAVPLTPDALRVIAQRWRPFEFGAETHRDAFGQLGRQTADDLAAAGLTANADEARGLLREWSFPMHSLDLRILEVADGPE